MNPNWKRDDILGHTSGQSAAEQAGYSHDSWWAYPMSREEFSSRARDEFPRMRILSHRAVVIAKDASA